MLSNYSIYISQFVSIFKTIYLHTMQDSKPYNSPKHNALKNNYGSPTNKVKVATSPNNINTAKSPTGTTSGIKVGQWKTQKNLNSNIDKSSNSDLNSAHSNSVKTINQQQVKSPKNAYRKEKPFGQKKSQISSPRSTLRASTMTIRQKTGHHAQQKSAANAKCQQCAKNAQESSKRVQQLSEKINSLEQTLISQRQKIESLIKQKKQLEDKAKKFEGVLAQNRKLVREKAMKFNNQGQQIKKLTDRILQLETQMEKMIIETEIRQKQFKAKQQQLAQLCLQNINNHEGFPNLLQVESEMVGSSNVDNMYLQKFMKTLNAKKQQKIGQNKHNQSIKIQCLEQSDIYGMLQSKTQVQSQEQIKAHQIIPSQNNRIELQKIKKQFNESLSEIQQTHEKRQKYLKQDLEQKQKSIRKLQECVENLKRSQCQTIKKQKQLKQQLEELQKQNGELRVLKSNNMFKKISTNTSETNLTNTSNTNKDQNIFIDYNKLKDSSRHSNRGNIINKLDRIKKISERQNQIIMQIKQSSKISLSSEISASRSTISIPLYQ